VGTRRQEQRRDDRYCSFTASCDRPTYRPNKVLMSTMHCYSSYVMHISGALGFTMQLTTQRRDGRRIHLTMIYTAISCIFHYIHTKSLPRRNLNFVYRTDRWVFIASFQSLTTRCGLRHCTTSLLFLGTVASHHDLWQPRESITSMACCTSILVKVSHPRTVHPTKLVCQVLASSSTT